MHGKRKNSEERRTSQRVSKIGERQERRER